MGGQPATAPSPWLKESQVVIQIDLFNKVSAVIPDGIYRRGDWYRSEPEGWSFQLH